MNQAKMIAILLFLVSAYESNAQKDLIDTSSIAQCWTHSVEENDLENNVNIYRPCGSKDFPVRRFRFVMELRRNGTCDWLYLAPTDAHHMKKGTWTYEESSQELTIRDENGKLVHAYKINTLDKHMMVVAKGN